MKISSRAFDLLLLVLLAALAFLPLVGEFGYYRDDWHVVWGATTGGTTSIIKQHSIDRPVMGMVYALVFQVLGYPPLNWNLFAVFMRLVGALGVYWAASLAFQRRSFAFPVALLFLLYPGFLQLPNGHTYQTHLTALAAGIFSLALTFFSLRTARISLKIAALLFSASLAVLCYLMYEWMVGIEAVRGIALAFLLVRKERSKWKNGLELGKTWVINLIAAAGYLYWRLRIFESLRAVTDIHSLRERYLGDFSGMALGLLVGILKDTWSALLAAWVQPLYSVLNNASVEDLGLALLLAGGCAALLAAAWKFQPVEYGEPGLPRYTELAALLCILVSVIPAALAGREILFVDGLDRYTLVPSLGAALLIASVISRLGHISLRRIAISGLAASALLVHILNGAYFRDWWDYQRQLWWQLSWRAPQIEEETVLVAALPERYALAEDYELWGPANINYYYSASSMGIYAQSLNQETVWSILGKGKEERNLRLVYFERDYRKTLVVSLPAGGACLHILGGDSIPTSSDSPLAVLVAQASRPERILANEKEHPPRPVIFGTAPEKGWCYYYQKASLAAQRKDWGSVKQLDQDARIQGFTPQVAIEWLPFYTAALETGDLLRSTQLAKLLKVDPSVRVYCASQPAPPAPLKSLCQ